MKEEEMAQKNAALWLQYSSLSLGRSSGTELLDNGGYARAPEKKTDTPRNVAVPEHKDRDEGVVL